mmetsp:Transcript_72455/g.212323  ORF Transcript_72455/g.212323 Transcript_72455/m.212323 type:complete len:333 (-) Transcript_72455:296-1294(-)
MCLGEARFQDGAHALAPKWADLSLESAGQGMDIDAAKAAELPVASTASESDMDTEYSSAASSHARNGDLSAAALDAASARIQPAPSTGRGCSIKAEVQAKGNLLQQHSSLCDGLTKLQEKQRQVLELLHSASVSRARQGTFSRQVSVATAGSEMSGESVTSAGDVSSQASGSSADDRDKPSRTLVELRLKHLQCMEIAKDQLVSEQAMGPAGASPGEGGPEDDCGGDMLHVIVAQITANHITQMGELRRLRDELAAKAEREAKLEAVLAEHAVLLSHYEALHGKHEALLSEFQAQAAQRAQQSPILHCASLGCAAAAAMAAGAVLWTLHAKR